MTFGGTGELFAQRGARLAGVFGVIGLLLVGCGELDPVRVQNLCEGSSPVPQQCPQCQAMPFAAECPQCQLSGSEEGTCLPPGQWSSAVATNGMAPVDAGQGTGPGSGGAQSADTTPGMAGAAASDNAGSQSPPVVGGGGTNVSAGSSGAAGVPAMPKSCRNDDDCHAEKGNPVCAPALQFCVECKHDSDCPAGQCDTSHYSCVECLDDRGCSSGPLKVCDRQSRKCVQCRYNTDCSGENPVCDGSVHRCVPCMGPGDCPAATPACENKACYECTNDTYCSGATPACLREEHVCVECVDSSQCRNVPGRPVCDTQEHTCVPCLSDGDCTDPTAAHCDDTHNCVSCSEHAHCARFAKTAPRCVKGSCVACDEDDGICLPRACILSENVCSTKLRHSIAVCKPCASSDECQSGACIPVMRGSYKTGNFCLYDATGLAAGLTCPAPYTRDLSNVPSVEGTNFEICAPPENVSCQAVLDAITNKPCTSNGQCGLDPTSTPIGEYDGYCSLSGCTYHCKSDDDCPSGKSCNQDQLICK